MNTRAEKRKMLVQLDYNKYNLYRLNLYFP